LKCLAVFLENQKAKLMIYLLLKARFFLEVEVKIQNGNNLANLMVMVIEEKIPLVKEIPREMVLV